MNLDRIGKYEIKGEIGRGTMGTVYKAWDPVLKRLVAIKTMVATPGRNDDSKQRFYREAEAAAHLSHPNIVTVHELGEEQGLIYMAMEHLDGEDLREVISAPTPKTLDECLHIMEQVAAGLAFAHSKGVVHRDLKPANIRVQPGGQVKIMDFGLARLGGSDLTQTGVVLGTPNYMSPEQALGDKVEARSDVFSAGGVFYELLTGRKPFDAETTPGVLYQVVHKEPTALRKWAPQVPAILAEVVDRCLAKDKNLRFQNGRQLGAALRVVRQALDAGRADTATLAEESQRANEEARKDGSSRGLSPAASRAPWVEGNVALEPGRDSRSQPRPGAPTLSGRAPTHPGHRRAQGRRLMVLSVVAGSLVFVVLGAAGYWGWMRGRAPVSPGEVAGPGPGAVAATQPSRAEVGALTQALVDSQIELAVKNLEDKNWAGAITQAERALGLQPGSARATQILEQAQGRRGELDKAAADARAAFEAGNLPEASRALARVLELDPKHPVVNELTARLNSTFRTRADEGQKLAQRARMEADKVKASTAPGFIEAAALLAEGDLLFRRSEFADATQRYLEARDGFDRARRSAPATGRSLPPAPLPAPTGLALVNDRPAPSSPAGTAAPGLATESALSAGREPSRRFVTGKSVVAGARSGGGLAGFDTADVKTQKVPDLVGRLDFEVEPPAPGSGDAVSVRVYLVNEGRKTVRVRSVAFSAIVDGGRTTLPGTPRERDVPAQVRALVAEARATWPATASSWSLEAILSSDRDETCTARLNWQ